MREKFKACYMGVMRPVCLALFIALLAACSDVRSFEQTSAQFQGDRAQLQRLAEVALACESASRFVARQNERGADCVNEVEQGLQALGYRTARVDEGRWRVAFVNGDDGTSTGVMSGIAYQRTPGASQYGERPLTEAPHQWFYFQHD